MQGNIVKILGVAINSTSAALVLNEIRNFEANLRLKKPLIVFTPNAEFLVEANKNLEFKKTLNSSDINLPDGFGLVLASRLLGGSISERVSGAEIVEKLLEIGDKERWKIGVAGARRGEAAEAKILFKRLSYKYPGIEFFNLDDSRLKVDKLRFDLVFACHGMKIQESWILTNREKIKTNVFMGIGGSLDFLTGFSRRAPLFIQKAGLEWLWRAFTKSGHLRRVWNAVAVFLWLLIKEKVAIARREIRN